MRWTTKALIQRFLSSVPLGEKTYFVGQRLAGGFRQFRIDGKIHQGQRLLKCLNQAGADLNGKNVVEVGTGWSPIVPLLFWLYGQGECTTFDTSKYLKDKLVIETARQIVNTPSAQLTPDKNPSSLAFAERQGLLSILVGKNACAKDILDVAQICYRAPADASKTEFDDESVDIVYSNTVLEHVPLAEIHGLFDESHRILKPGGSILHLIDLSDHFYHGDSSITSINFLQFSETKFAKYNSRFLFQNRLRASAWREIIQSHGFEIVCWQVRVNEKAMKELPSLELDDAFSDLSAEDLCTSSVCVVANRK